MVTENNSLINTFVKGMNSDTSYQMLDELSYALAENLRLLSLGEGNKHGELRPIPGLKIAFEYIKSDCTHILAATSIRDYGIIIIKLKNGKWKVYRFRCANGRVSGFVVPTDLTCIFTSKNTTKAVKFDVVTRFEDDDNIKLYIADGNNPIMCLNITQIYGPTVGEEEISSYPSALLAAPLFEEYVSGNIKAGLVQYSYRLYRKNSVASEISPCTTLIPIYGSDGRGLLEGKRSSYGVKISIPFYEENKHFDRIMVYRIHYSINGQNPTIELICDQLLLDSYNSKFYIIDFGTLSLQTITLEEYNSMSGIHVIPKTIESQNDYLFAGCIKSEEGILANKEILEWDARTYSCNKEGYFSVKNENGTGEVNFIMKRRSGSDEIIYVDPTDLITEVHPENTDGYTDYVNMSVDKMEISEDDYAYIWPLFDKDSGTPLKGILGGCGKNIQWRFTYIESKIDANVYSVDEYNNKRTFDEKRTLVYQGIDRTSIQSGNRVRSLRRGELYRYGIVLYDKFGNASPVKWIADIRVPIRGYFDSFDGYGSSKSIGVMFTVNNLPEDVVGYEIVRCNRTINDIKTLSQGVISKPGRTYEFYSGKQDEMSIPYPFSPTGYLTAFDLSIRTYKTTYESDVDILSKYSTYKNDGLYLFISPEICFQKESFKDILSTSSLKLNPIKWICSNKEAKSGSDHYDPMYYLKENYFDKLLSPIITVDEYVSLLNLLTSRNEHARINITNDNLLVNGGFYAPKTKNTDDNRNVINKYVQNKKDAFVYAKLYSTKNMPKGVEIKTYDIKNSTVASDLSQYDFISDKTVKYKNHQDVCGKYSFCNTVVGTAYAILTYEGLVDDEYLKPITKNDHHANFNIFGLGGRCALLDLGEIISTPLVYDGGTYLCNLQHNVTPYGGYSKSAKESNTYYSYGNFVKVEKSVPGSSKPSGINVFDGDCYIDIFEYVSQHKLYCPDDVATIPSISVIYAIPVETNINLALTSGYEFSREKDPYKQDLQIEPTNMYSGLILSKPAYEYNSVYSSSAKARVFQSQLNDLDLYNSNFDYRVRHSNLKSNNEQIDSWLKFLAADYIDLDTKHGRVTNLKSHNNKLYFWLKNAVGLLSVNERTVMNTENNLPLIIGEGGVLTRYDYIDEHSGMYEDLFCTAHSSNLLYYFDDQNQTIKAIQGGTVVDLPSSKNVKNTMIENESRTNNPIMFFDDEYDEMIANVFDDKSLVYNEKITAFTSLYTVGFDGVIQFPNRTYLIKNDKVGNKIKFAQWNILNGNTPCGFDSTALNIKLRYVVNKMNTVTKVFDNQEIITSNPSDANFDEFQYKWKTDLNQSTTDQLELTDREGNFRFAIPRSVNSVYGNRVRGKYMVCDIVGAPRTDKTSISYIITKLRGSFA